MKEISGDKTSPRIELNFEPHRNGDVNVKSFFASMNAGELAGEIIEKVESLRVVLGEIQEISPGLVGSKPVRDMSISECVKAAKAVSMFAKTLSEEIDCERTGNR